MSCDRVSYPLEPRTDDQRLKRNKSFWLNIATAPLRSLPHFLIIGEMKSGTSSLFHYLAQHPSVKPPIRKEIHYFSVGYGKGLSWYRAHYPLARSLRGAITGEGCPGYLFAPEADKRILRTIPKSRFIVLLRDPVERAISHYYHEVRLGRETLPLMQALEVEETRLAEASSLPSEKHLETYLHASYKKRGHYAESLERFFRSFPREQFLILGSGFFFRDPAAALDRLYRFLDLEPLNRQRDYPVKNQGKHNSTDDSARSYLEGYFAPHNERLSDLLHEQLEL